MGYPPCVSFGCEGQAGKRWPALVGKPGLEAKKIIEGQDPQVTAVIIPKDNIRDMNFCCNRVWLNVNNDPQQTVATVPQVG